MDRDEPAAAAALLIGGADPGRVERVRDAAVAAVGDLGRATAAAVAIGAVVDGPGGGGTADYLSALAALGSVDLTVARVVEPHLDALAILRQAAVEPGAGVYGVYAAERPGLPAVEATAGDRVRLRGVKPWCSLAGRLDRALVTAEQDGARRLFDLDLHDPGASAVPGTWVSRGLVAVDSGDLRLDGVAAAAVGGAGWYAGRPGFAWGGIGVAACWYGGAVGVAGALRRAAAGRPPDQLAHAAIGECDRLLWACARTLDDAAARIDDGRARGMDGALLALRVRGTIAEAAERVLAVVGHALGPAPLTFDEQHARRAADLTVYLRQHHAGRDDARAGEALLRGDCGAG